MICAFGRTSQSTRETIKILTCAARTASRPRRSRRSHARYCGLGLTAAPTDSAFDMDFELLPEGVEIPVEFRRIARCEWSRTGPVASREANAMFRLDPARAPRQHDDTIGHADGLADI